MINTINLRNLFTNSISRQIKRQFQKMEAPSNFGEMCKKCNILPKINFVGGGNMAQALMSGFLSAGIITPDNISVADTSENIRKILQIKKVRTFDSTPKLLQSSENGIIILAIKPSSVKTFFQSLQNPKTIGLFVSVCAGVSLQTLEEHLSLVYKDTAVPVVRVMPNTPALVGQGASAFSLGEHASAEHANIVQCMFATVGTCDQVPETLMDAVTGLSASGPAFVYTMIDALSDGGVKVGIPRELSTKLAVQTVLGSAQMLQKSGKHPGEMKNMVCSPGGTTIAGVYALEAGGVRAAFMAAVEAATKRAEELGKM